MAEDNTSTETTEQTPPAPPVIPENVEVADTPPINPLAAPEGEGDTSAPPVVTNDWLPEDLRGNERLQNFESPEALARAFAEAELAQATPEEYTLPEGQPKELGAWAKSAKLSQEQLNAMLQLKTGLDTYESETKTRVYAEGRKQLFESWGKKKDENLKIAESVFSAIPSGQKLATFIQNSGEGANPVVIQALHELGNHLKEGGYVSNSNVTGKENPNPLKSRYPTMFPQDKE